MVRPEAAEGLSRRRILNLGAGAVAGLLTRPLESAAFGRSQLAPNATASGPVLPIPERLEGSAFNLRMRAGEREFLPGLRTPTKGYNGDFLGPTLVMRSGSNVTLNVSNDIGVTTSTHWHRMHVPAVMDGGPHQRIEPGETWTASFPVLNRAGTYWYHPHPHPRPAHVTCWRRAGRCSTSIERRHSRRTCRRRRCPTGTSGGALRIQLERSVGSELCQAPWRPLEPAGQFSHAVFQRRHGNGTSQSTLVHPCLAVRAGRPPRR